MQQAYLALGYNPNLATVTNLYVRFLPTVAQVAALDSIMDAQGLDLFDTPMDYDVTYEGDYYQDPSIPDSLPTWQYAVVPPNFVFPSGITYQTLAQIHIPPDAYTAIETEAEAIAGGGGGGNNSVQANGTVQPNTGACLPGYHWDFTQGMCVPNNCPAGYQWNGTTCVPITCPAGEYYDGVSCVPYNTTPPAQAADAQIPQGNITVFDTNLPNSSGSELPVRKVRMVARRWFKIDRVFTDAITGHFVFNKHFKHKVRIIERFKNSDAYIYGIRGVRLWQMLFPVKRELGIYSGDKSNINFSNDQTGPVNSKGNRYWAAATVHNVVQEHRAYATQLGFSAAPTTLNIYITNWGMFSGLSSTPLFHKRFVKDLPSSFINTFLVYSGAAVVAGGVAALAAVVARENVDIVVDYHTGLSTFKSDWLKETAYHEMSHASHYSQVGTNWYSQFVNAELAEQAKHPLPSDTYNPYGDGGSSNSPIIALGECWAYHMGHYLADQTYGVNASCTSEGQQYSYCPNPMGNPPYTAHPHIDVLENWNPNYTSDPFRWTPKGLMEDLIDNTPTETFPVIDNISGLTITQLFAALQSDVTTVQLYKAKLISQNPTLSTPITNLFAQYHY